jgi:hypothetical protein
MTAKPVLIAIVALVGAGCQQQVAAPPAASSEPLDPFVVMVDAERWGVIIDRAREGVREAPGPADADAGNEMYRADAALKSGSAALIELRNEACVKGLVTGAACDLGEWPAWTREAPTGKTPISEIDRRSQWLGATMAPFTEAGCEAGRKATGEELFCSVE